MKAENDLIRDENIKMKELLTEELLAYMSFC